MEREEQWLTLPQGLLGPTMLVLSFLCCSPLADFQSPDYPYFVYKCLLPSFSPFCISYHLMCHCKDSDYPKSKVPLFYLIVPLSVYRLHQIAITHMQIRCACKLDVCVNYMLRYDNGISPSSWCFVLRRWLTMFQAGLDFSM